MTEKNALPIPTAEKLIDRLADQINIHLTENAALVGIQYGGAMVLNRLLSILDESIDSQNIPSGMLDVAMHRDDYATKGLKTNAKPTNLAFDVQGKDIILIDDVFFTGRTARAAMNELFDYGRPASITLAVLINRGGSELPIMPQIAAYATQIDASHHLQLQQDEAGGLMLKCGDMHSGKQ